MSKKKIAMTIEIPLDLVKNIKRESREVFRGVDMRVRVVPNKKREKGGAKNLKHLTGEE